MKKTRPKPAQRADVHGVDQRQHLIRDFPAFVPERFEEKIGLSGGLLVHAHSL